jgi:hypothetical protein
LCSGWWVGVESEFSDRFWLELSLGQAKQQLMQSIGPSRNHVCKICHHKDALCQEADPSDILCGSDVWRHSRGQNGHCMSRPWEE